MGPKKTAISHTGISQLVPAAELAEAAREFAEASDAENTILAYAKQWAQFEEWCRLRGVPALPAAPEALAGYLTERALQGARIATLEQAIAAIGRRHFEADFAEPHRSKIVKRIWKGIRRRVGTAKRGAKPLSPESLRRMIRSYRNRYPLVCTRNAALLLIGFGAALRRGELVALRVEDLTFEEGGVKVFVAKSKTDQEQKGVSVGVRPGSDPTTCPVRALQTWLVASGIESGLVFRGLRNGQLTDKALSGYDVSRIVKEMARAANLNVERLSGHSLRAGLGTTAAKNGKSLSEIQKHMRHKGVEQTLGYIRDANLLSDENVTTGIGL